MRNEKMSEELQKVVYSGIISIVISIITAIFTSKQTLKQEVKKRIHEHREEVYVECFDLLQRVKDDPFSVFNNTLFFQPLCSLRTKLNLYASQEVLNILEPFYREVKRTNEAYWELFSGEEYESLKQARAEHEGMTEVDFQNEEDRYMADHLLNENLVDTTFEKMVTAMRKDMGTVK
jgi:hypothetical protein